MCDQSANSKLKGALTHTRTGKPFLSGGLLGWCPKLHARRYCKDTCRIYLVLQSRCQVKNQEFKWMFIHELFVDFEIPAVCAALRDTTRRLRQVTDGADSGVPPPAIDLLDPSGAHVFW